MYCATVLHIESSNLIIIQFSAFSCKFLHVRSKYSLEHKQTHPQSMFRVGRKTWHIVLTGFI